MKDNQLNKDPIRHIHILIVNETFTGDPSKRNVCLSKLQQRVFCCMCRVELKTSLNISRLSNYSLDLTDANTMKVSMPAGLIVHCLSLKMSGEEIDLEMKRNWNFIVALPNVKHVKTLLCCFYWSSVLGHFQSYFPLESLLVLLLNAWHLRFNCPENGYGKYPGGNKYLRDLVDISQGKGISCTRQIMVYGFKIIIGFTCNHYSIYSNSPSSSPTKHPQRIIWLKSSKLIRNLNRSFNI